jgi:hypothetical protein
MESSSNSSKKQPAAGGAACSGKPARTHWRRRDPADTSVYVVHPDQFRAVVQQLTGAAASPPAPPPVAAHHQGGNNGTTAAHQTQPADGTAGASDALLQRGGSRGEENSSSRGVKTLGQIHDECMAWASADDCDLHIN